MPQPWEMDYTPQGQPITPQPGIGRPVIRRGAEPPKPDLPQGWRFNPTTQQAERVPGLPSAFTEPKPESNNLPSGYRMNATTGKAERIPGLPAVSDDVKLTEAQGKASSFYESAVQANKAYEALPISTKPRSVAGQTAVNAFPMLGTALSSSERQQADSQARSFVNNILRFESGAQITPAEFDSAYKTYFPQPGEGPAAVEAKRILRQQKLDSMKVPAGPGIDGFVPAEPKTAVPPSGQQRSDGTEQLLIGGGSLHAGLTGTPDVPKGPPLTPEQVTAYDAFLKANPKVTGPQLAQFYSALTGGGTLKNADAIAKAAQSGGGFASGAEAILAPPDISDARSKGGALETADAVVRGAADTPTLGFADELAAIGDTVTKGGTYQQNLDRQRAIDEYDAEKHPIARFTGQLAGAIAIPTGVENMARGAAVKVLRAGGTREEALIAARTAATKQLTKEGAAYGAGYGAGSSNGDITDRAANAAVSSIFGAGAGAGLGVVGGRLAARRGAGQAADRRAQLETAQAAQDLGIDLPRFVAGGPSAQAAGNRAEQTVFGGPVIRGAREGLVDEAQQARDRIAASVGTPQEPEAMGETGVQGAKEWRGAARSEGRGLYATARKSSEGVDIAPQRVTETLDRLIQEDSQVPGGTDMTDLLHRYAQAFADGGRITIDGARRMRSTLRKRLRETTTPDDADRITNQIMGAVGEDIETALRAAGKPEAVNDYRRADRFWANMMDTEEDLMRPYVGKAGDNWGANVAKAINNDAKGNGARLSQFLNTIPEGEANDVRASLINRLGRSTDGQQDAPGNAFSLDLFLTHWNQIRNSREQIFGQETTKALNQLALIANRAKIAAKTRNNSFTGSIVSGVATSLPTVLGVGAAAMSHDLSYFAIGSALSSLGAGKQYVTARLLASPAFARKLAATPMKAADARSYWSQPWVAKLARSEPAISSEILGFQQSMLNTLGETTRPLAADSGQQQQNGAQ